MPNFHFSGDTEVKTQTIESVIGEAVYHLSQLHDRAVALYSSAVMLRQQIVTQINGLQSRRNDYRKLASDLALLAVIAEVSAASDQDLAKILVAADAQTPLPEGKHEGNLPRDIIQSLNSYGGGMILGQLVVRLGLLAKDGLTRIANNLAPEAVEELPEALADAGVSVAQPTAEEASMQVAEAIGADAADTLSAASVAAAGVGFLITAGLEIGLGWSSAKQNAEQLQQTITDYQSKVDKLTSYSRTVTALYNKTYAAVRSEQQRINAILTALAGVFEPIEQHLPEPDPTRVAETLRVAQKAIRQYTVYADVRIQWQKWVTSSKGDRPNAARSFTDWYVDAAPSGVTREQLEKCVKILCKYSDTYHQSDMLTTS